MFKKARKIFTAILSLVLAVSMIAAPVCANGIDVRAVALEPGIEPQWKNVGAATVALGFDGSTIVISTVVTAYTGTTFSGGVVLLTKLTGEGAGTTTRWTGLSSSTNIFKFSNYSLTATRGLYRLNFRLIATRNGVSEVINLYKDATY